MPAWPQRRRGVRLVEGENREVAVPLLSLHREPRFDARLDTQALLGERVRVFDSREGWAWLQLETDGYVGYAAQDDLSVPRSEPTHRVAVPSTFMFPAPDIKSQPAVTLTMNAKVSVIRRGREIRPSRQRPLCHRPPSQAVERERTGFRCRRRGLSARALSLGRQVRPGARLLGPGATGAGGVGSRLPARFRHAGGRARPGAAEG